MKFEGGRAEIMGNTKGSILNQDKHGQGPTQSCSFDFKPYMTQSYVIKTRLFSQWLPFRVTIQHAHVESLSYTQIHRFHLHNEASNLSSCGSRQPPANTKRPRANICWLWNGMEKSLLSSLTVCLKIQYSPKEHPCLFLSY